MDKKIEQKKRINIIELVPWLGFALMQTMNIPNVIQALKTGQSMPVASVVLLLSALCCYMVDAIRRRLVLHIVSSGIGLLSNGIVLLCII